MPEDLTTFLEFLIGVPESLDMLIQKCKLAKYYHVKEGKCSSFQRW